VGANISSVVLSFDGPADVQNLHRQFRNGTASFDTVCRTAKQLSASPAQLCLRACVTQATVPRMPEIAAWFCQEFNPAIISFEPLQQSAWSQTAQLQPPDPWDFARDLLPGGG
jgi:sulfatase maturation enzyme AslB (radical SAM superfamily)